MTVNKLKPIHDRRETDLNVYNTIVTQMNEGLVHVDNDDVIQFVNDQFCDLIGYTREELIGRIAYEILLFEEDIPLLKSKIKDRIEHKSERYTIKMRKKSGGFIWFLVSGAPVIDKNGNVIGSLGIHTDVTETKRKDDIQKVLYNILDAMTKTETLEDLVKQIHCQINGLMEAENFFVALYDPSTETYTYPYYKDEFFEYDGTIPERIEGSLTEYVRVTKKPLLLDKKSFEEFLASGKAVLIGKAAESWLGVPLEVGGNIIGVVATQSYTSPDAYSEEELKVLAYVSGHIALAIDKKRSEQSSKESDQRFKDLANLLPQTVFEIDLDGKLTFVNQEALKIFGYTVKEFNAGLNAFSFFPPEEHPNIKKNLASIFKGTEVGFVERVALKKDNTRMPVLIDTRAVIKDNKVIGFRGICIDISDRKKVEDELNNYLSLLESTMDSTDDGILVTDLGRSVAFLNKSFKELWKVPDGMVAEGDDKMLEFACTQISNSDEFLEKVEYLYANPEEESYDVIDFKDGRILERYSRPHKVAGAIKGRVWSFREVTERKKAEEENKKLEEQLFHSQKMESIGRLAGGIAHDFNNILTSMMIDVELLQMKLKNSENESLFESESAGSIIRGLESAAHLTKQLLGFARGGKYNPVPINVNDLIVETVKVSSKIFEKNIDVEYQFDGVLKPIEADKHQLEQVFTNLLINAKDAMPNGGEIIIKTSIIHLEKGKWPGFKSGEYVEISLEDTGIGMSPYILENIFEPFFTTKGEAKGTGLGLATVYGIVKNHGGYIFAESEPDQGTKFTLYFPSSNKKVVSPSIEPDIVRGDETILIIDDEDDVRNATKKMLAELGYNIHAASDGEEGVRLYKTNKNEIDLVLLDVIMPEMSGSETFYALKEINADIKVLIFSGYSQDGKANEIIRAGAIGFVQKPFKIQEMSKKIRDVLGARLIK